MSDTAHCVLLYRSLFVDTLVNLGTNPAFLFGKYLIENKKAQPDETEYFIKQLQFHLKEVSGVLLEKYKVEFALGLSLK